MSSLAVDHQDSSDSDSDLDRVDFRLTNRDLRIAEEDLRETQQRRKQSLKEIRSWLKTQTHLVNVRADTSFLLRFLRFQKFHLPETQAVMDKYVHMRTVHKEWFHNLDVREPKLNALFSSGYLVVLPKRDLNGRRVVFSKGASMDTAQFTACDVMRAHILTYETLLCDEENQIKGLTYVFDEREINWSHIGLFSPSEISKAFSCCERALPLRHQEIHFVHLPWTLNLVFQFGKSLLSQKLRERFQTHPNFEDLAQTFPSGILPSEYCGGGKQSLDEVIKVWLEELESKRSEVLALDRMNYSLCRKMSSSACSVEEGVLDVVSSVRKMENGKDV